MSLLLTDGISAKVASELKLADFELGRVKIFEGVALCYVKKILTSSQPKYDGFGRNGLLAEVPK